MDRFKFRVYNKNSNNYIKEKMFYINEFGGLFKYEQSKSTVYINAPSPCVMCFCGDNYIVEQCTGLKDINGKLIYEGDILKDNHGRIARVYWSVTWCEFEVVYTHNNTGTIYSFTDWAYEKRCRTEIIGNIHENKDLLEE